MSDVVSKLTKKQREELAIAAIKAANELGYCDQTRMVLSELGFDVEDRPVKVKLEFDLYVPFGILPEDLTWYITGENSEGSTWEAYDNINVVS